MSILLHNNVLEKRLKLVYNIKLQNMDLDPKIFIKDVIILLLQ